METYDENLNNNDLFKYIKLQYKELFVDIVKENWLLCLPKSDALHPPFTPDDVLQHVLIPLEEDNPEVCTAYKTLKGSKVEIKGNSIYTTCDKNCNELAHENCSEKVNILFSEPFYDKKIGKFKVICLHHSLADALIGCLDNSVTKENFNDGQFDFWLEQPFGSFRECVNQLLDKSALSSVSIIDISMQNILSNEMLTFCSSSDLRDEVFHIFEHTFSSLSENLKSSAEENMIKLLELSIESFLLHSLYTKIMKNIIYNTVAQDEKLNRKIMKYSEITLLDLNIDLGENKVYLNNCAKYELAMINRVTTPIGKLKCLKNAMAHFHSVKNLNSDNLIFLIVYLIIKTKLPSWFANLNYIKLFGFSSEMKSVNNEKKFLLTTLEASLTYIVSNDFEKLFSHGFYNIPFLDTDANNENKFLLNLYREIREANLENVQQLFKFKKSEINRMNEALVDRLCHPLCSCTKCSTLVIGNDISSLSLVNSRGFSPLHVACQFGQLNIIEYFIDAGADIELRENSGKSPLHLSAQNGHQNALLLLLHSGASLNSMDIDGNTPLHLACLGGHESCVKAIMFYAELQNLEFVFAIQNEKGETPLHLVCYWGYISIIKFISEQMITLQLNYEIKNKQSQLPSDCSMNDQIAVMLNKIRIGEANANEDVCAGLNSKSYKNYNLEQSTEMKSSACNSDSEMEDKLKKVLNAASKEDNKLAFFFLGIDENIILEKYSPFRSLCHPLCQCINCQGIAVTMNVDKKLLNYIGNDGLNVLHFSVMHQNIPLCKALILCGSDLNITTNGIKMESVLHLAVENKNLELLNLLLESNSSVNMIDHCGNTPLHKCCNIGWLEGAISLLQHKADTKLTNRENLSPCEEASKNGYINIVKLLLEF